MGDFSKVGQIGYRMNIKVAKYEIVHKEYNSKCHVIFLLPHYEI